MIRAPLVHDDAMCDAPLTVPLLQPVDVPAGERVHRPDTLGFDAVGRQAMGFGVGDGAGDLDVRLTEGCIVAENRFVSAG